MLFVFDAWSSVSAQVTEAIACDEPVPRGEGLALMLARIGDLERAGMA